MPHAGEAEAGAGTQQARPPDRRLLRHRGVRASPADFSTVRNGCCPLLSISSFLSRNAGDSVRALFDRFAINEALF
jgi:hypothetical protein